MKYVLITPARNEASLIERTIQSVVAQTHQPLRWVIVSDGSTDGTDEIVQKYAAAHPWIELLRMPERKERHFAGKVHAFRAGWDKVKGLDYEIIGNLDADITFEPDLFAFLMGKFAENPRLGLAGTPFVEDGQTYDFRFASLEHVSGACQMFRREAFEEIGGYQPLKSGGIDLVAVLSVRMKGWQSRTFLEKHCIHHRKQGSATHGGSKHCLYLGRQDYAMGSHPVWEVFRATNRLRQPPLIVGGACMLFGYFWPWVRRKPRVVAKEMAAFRQKDQMIRLRAIFLRALGFAPRRSESDGTRVVPTAKDLTAPPSTEIRKMGLDGRKPKMWITTKIRNVLRGRLLRWGGSRVKRMIWNREFARGRWNCLYHTEHHPIYAFIERHARHGSILDLGCGSGNTANELNFESYSSYLGVDVSDVAVEKAKARTAENKRESKARFIAADIYPFVPDSSFDLIVFRESIYYNPIGKVAGLLRRYAAFLKPGGVLLVCIYDRDAYQAYVDVIENEFQVIEKYAPEGSQIIVVVFRPGERAMT